MPSLNFNIFFYIIYKNAHRPYAKSSAHAKRRHFAVCEHFQKGMRFISKAKRD